MKDLVQTKLNALSEGKSFYFTDVGNPTKHIRLENLLFGRIKVVNTITGKFSEVKGEETVYRTKTLIEVLL
jgi:hypothetical protein